MSRDRVVQIIGEAITAEVMVNACREIMAGETNAVDVLRIAETAADRLTAEGLI